MGSARDDIAGVELALERLFRLTVNRKAHTRQTAAVGADVTRAGYAVLRCVDEAGELSLGELARECSMDPAAAGRQVRLLEEDGLVTRTAGAGDARVTLVRLTPAGRKVYRRIVEVRSGYLRDVLAQWPSHQRKALADLVGRLVDDMRAVPYRPATRTTRKKG